jgi:uncharacterized protein (TIGR01777 family)
VILLPSIYYYFYVFYYFLSLIFVIIYKIYSKDTIMKIAISGASGFVGNHLQNLFNYAEIVTIGRRELKLDDSEFVKLIDGVDIVINLAGAPIINRWTQEYIQELYSSRIDTTKKIVNAIASSENKPKLFISTSAVGRYDNKARYTEDDKNYADDTLGNICKDWEEEALKAKSLTRVVIYRFGVVLGRDGGALAKMLLPFKLGVGGILGSGEQYFPWVHIADLKRAFMYAVESDSVEGIYNLTSPSSVTNYEYTKALGKVLGRPTIFPVPAFIIKLIFGEGSCVLLDGQNVAPKRLLDSGFEFKFGDLERALEDLTN